MEPTQSLKENKCKLHHKNFLPCQSNKKLGLSKTTRLFLLTEEIATYLLKMTYEHLAERELSAKRPCAWLTWPPILFFQICLIEQSTKMICVF